MKNQEPLRSTHRGAIHTTPGRGGITYRPGTHMYRAPSHRYKPGVHTYRGPGGGTGLSTTTRGGLTRTTTCGHAWFEKAMARANVMNVFFMFLLQCRVDYAL